MKGTLGNKARDEGTKAYKALDDENSMVTAKKHSQSMGDIPLELPGSLEQSSTTTFISQNCNHSFSCPVYYSP